MAEMSTFGPLGAAVAIPSAASAQTSAAERERNKAVVRRFKERTGTAGSLVCVGTSATVLATALGTLATEFGVPAFAQQNRARAV